MHMRYHPRYIKQLSRMKVKQGDRGKKHYWGYEKGDYGFYLSQDQQQMKKIKRLRHAYNYRNNTIQTQVLSRQDHYNNDMIQNPETPMKMNVNKFVDTQQIKLPFISKTSRETQTSEVKNHQGSNKELQISQNDKKQVEQNNKNNKIFQKHKRLSTEPTQNFANPQYKFSQRTRFSPTFVCSLQNPLPSYILEPQIYNSFNYIRSESLPHRNLNKYKY